MLLSVSLLAEAGELDHNQIKYGPRLLEVFRLLFSVARQSTDQFTPFNPFFYLKSDGFWHLHPKPGMEQQLKLQRTINGVGQLMELVAYASLDQDVYLRLLAPEFRHAFQATLVQEYLNHASSPVWAVLKDETLIATQRKQLIDSVEPPTSKKAPHRIRSTAFRRMILDLYDMRCAACGTRFFVKEDDLSVDLVDAAHLVPFSESEDDRPQNGIALCKNHHWLMDHAILAPGPGARKNYDRPIWHVRDGLDARIEEHRPVLELKGKLVLTPRDRTFIPAKDGLDWRMEQLRGGRQVVDFEDAG